MSINVSLKNIIKEKGYTIAKLASEINITPANLSKLINNRVSEIKLETLNKLCEKLECTPGEILKYNSLTKKKVIPFFFDYVGGIDDILDEGIKNFIMFLNFIKKFQSEKNIEIRIVLITGLPFEAAKQRFRLLNHLAESYELPELFYGTSMEYSGFFMDSKKITQLQMLDPRILEKRIDIEMIASQYDVELSKQYSSIYNLFFDKPISRSKMSELSEKLDTAINCDDIETVTYFDKYGCEIDIKNKKQSKSTAILSIMNILKSEYDIPLVVIGGAPLKVNWEMYINSKEELNKMGYNVLDIITTEFEEASEINRDDQNVICLNLKEYKEIIRLFSEIYMRLNMNNRRT